MRDDELMRVAGELCDREARVLLRIASRLLFGQQEYGPLTFGKKDWKDEAHQESLDMAIYLSVLLEDDNENA